MSDHDVIIINVAPFEDEEFCRSINIDTLPSVEDFTRHLFSEDGEMLVIGSPHFQLGNNPYRPGQWWAPIMPICKRAEGEVICNVDEDYAFYFRNVKRWSFHTTTETYSLFGNYVQPLLRLIHPAANDLQLYTRGLAKTRFGEAIGFEMRFEAVRIPERLSPYSPPPTSSECQVVRASRQIVWLPAPTEITDTEAVGLVLAERYKVASRRQPPGWASSFALPSQVTASQEVQRIQNEIRQQESALKQAEQDSENEARFVALLYEQGQDALEPIVRESLRQLGARVDEPKVAGREDGRLVAPPGNNGMLEIKGRTGTLKLADVRQLDQWVRDAAIDERWDSKGILIASVLCGVEPKLRRDPYPKNCVEAAERFGLCLLSTHQIFRALQLLQESKLDTAAFWSKVFSTAGVCNLTEIGI